VPQKPVHAFTRALWDSPEKRAKNDRFGSPPVCAIEEFVMKTQCWSAGESLDDLARTGDLSDRISSIRILGRSRVVVYRDIRFGGGEVVIDYDMPDLAQVSRKWLQELFVAFPFLFFAVTYRSILCASARGSAYPWRGSRYGATFHH